MLLMWIHPANVFSMYKRIEKTVPQILELICSGDPYIGCEVNVKKMNDNPHFNIEKKIKEHPNDDTVILELFDASMGNKI